MEHNAHLSFAAPYNVLSQLRGRVKEKAPLGPLTWFRVGGAADYLFKPADRQDLQTFMQHRDPDLPYIVLGVGSNVLIRDGGMDGVVIRLGGEFAHVQPDSSKAQIYAGAGALDQTVALHCAEAGIGGLAFLSGVPGTIGGALRMNAGAYGKEVKDVLIQADVLFPNGEIKTLSNAELHFRYRHCGLEDGVIFLGGLFQGEPADPAQIHQEMAVIREQRETSQPTRARTGGSTFTNPAGYKAWQLIDQAQCRGLRQGGAMVSDKHCNFLINEGDATASDIEMLGEEIRRRVYDLSGIDLHWEIRRLGRNLTSLHDKSNTTRAESA